MIKPNTPTRFTEKTMSPEVSEKVRLSFMECEELTEREVKCPVCNFVVDMVMSDAKGHIRPKCAKCGSQAVLNLAYFKTISGFGKRRQRALASESTELYIPKS